MTTMFSTMTFCHGSRVYLRVGTILVPRPDYEQTWGDTSFYAPLERHRPPQCLAQAQAVFMCDNADDVDLAAGGSRWLFTVEPLGRVHRHDLNWGSALGGAVDNGEGEDVIVEHCQKYWSGVPYEGENLWEYLTPAARIVAVESF